MNKYILLIVGIIALWAGIVFNDKAKYPSGTAGSKWGMPLIVLGSAGILVFLFFFAQSFGFKGLGK